MAVIEGRERKRNEKREKKGREIYILMERGAERVQFLLEELKRQKEAKELRDRNGFYYKISIKPKLYY